MMLTFKPSSIRKTLVAGLLAATMAFNMAMPVFAAPLYKSTMAMSGLFPWASNWQQSIVRTKNLGFTIGRMDLLWHWVEKRRGVYDFTFYDQVYNYMTANGIKPVFILCYNNALYSGTSNTQVGVSTQANRDAFTRFAAAAAARYKGKGIIWEVWNEPDIAQFWGPSPSATNYAALAVATTNAMRQADPNAYIASAGISHMLWDQNFVQSAMQAGMLRNMNAFAVHGYNYLNPPQIIEQQEAQYAKFRQWMSQYNGGKVLPIINTEFGAKLSWQQKVSSNPMDYAAKQNVRYNLDNYFSGVYLSAVYGMNSGDEFDLWKDTQMTQALNYSNKLLADFEGTNLNYGANMRGILFKNPANGQQIIAMWPTTGTQSITFPAPLSVQRITNVYGQQLRGAGTITSFSQSVAGGPVFIALSGTVTPSPTPTPEPCTCP
jgi:hypothetical protein